MDDFVVVTEGQNLDSALAEASALLECAPEDVGWMEIPSDNGSVRMAAVGLNRSPDGPGRIVDDHAQPWPHIPPQRALPLEKPRKIDGDITALSGEVRHYGDIIVAGSVRKGAAVSAAGALLILGDVEAGAHVSAHSNITVKSGIHGEASSPAGDLTCGYAYGARLNGGEIDIYTDATQSIINARGSVHCGGAVVGSRVYAGLRIQVKTLGADGDVGSALLAVVPERRKQERLRSLDARLKRIEGEAAVPSGDGVGRIDLQTLRAVYRAARQRLLLPDRSGKAALEITVSGRCHAGSTVMIDAALLEAKQDAECIRYSKDAQSGMLIAESDE